MADGGVPKADLETGRAAGPGAAVRPAPAGPRRTGTTPLLSCRADPRFGYSLFVPPRLRGTDRVPLLVSVHGSLRGVESSRDAFADFARWHGAVVLAPLFPADPLGDGNEDGYKYMVEGDIRYDRLLLTMVAEAEARTGLGFDRFCLAGFSGGAHFAHRFLYLHPERLRAVSIGAPGSVTLIDPKRDWWVGTRDMERLFGRAPDLETMRRVPVHLAIGDSDLETASITHRPGSRHWMEDANRAGANRIARLTSLRRNLQAHGLAVRHDIIPGAAHDFAAVAERARDFFHDVLGPGRAPTFGS
ncbi:alpha/beta hydrolase [Inquilinus sp. NPDC058860]|uniref:alpha/beta hydrolase n=1 Tax=Inquilinus sp. NPDC058860 TaxID=3346652 RepID=UPI0036906A53